MLNVHRNGKDGDACNIKIGHDLALVVERVVETGEEFYANYQYNWILFNMLSIIY